jgi:hypothetical protein
MGGGVRWREKREGGGGEKSGHMVKIKIMYLLTK